jgi:tetratricopeptide (TPR) repeat protein
MALVKCIECKKEISNTAKSCPHCGAKIKKSHVLRWILIILLIACGVIVSLAIYRTRGYGNYNKGIIYQESGQSVLADQQYKLALQRNPDLAEAHLNLGVTYLSRGWYDKAEASTKKAVEILERTRTTMIEGSTWKETLSLAYTNLGSIELNRGFGAAYDFDHVKEEVHFKNAISFFQKALEFNPSNTNAKTKIQMLKDPD